MLLWSMAEDYQIHLRVLRFRFTHIIEGRASFPAYQMQRRDGVETVTTHHLSSSKLAKWDESHGFMTAIQLCEASFFNKRRS